MSWPTCRAKIGGPLFDDRTLSCALPEGHEMDGDPMHCDPVEGVRWALSMSIGRIELPCPPPTE